MDSGKRIAKLVQEACIREVCTPKPGNVDRCHDFIDTSFEDFLLSAIAIGPAFEDAGRVGVGRTILKAVEASRQQVQSNTNLGITLLLAGSHTFINQVFLTKRGEIQFYQGLL